jgi:hypothetical protein
MSGLRFTEKFIPDDGFDLDAYVGAAASLGRPRYCFVNSFSRIRAHGWLAALDGALARPGVGLVGATGSWASICSYALYELGFPSAYRAIFDDRARTRERMRRLGSDDPGAPVPYHRRDPAMLIDGARTVLERVSRFRRFPAPHVRTNAFAARAETLARLDVGRLDRKGQAHRVESGRVSITRQVERIGFAAVVAGRDGVYEPGDWPASETFWQGDQANLLVSDNQTDKYDAGDAETRELLSHFAWGARAQPATS